MDRKRRVWWSLQITAATTLIAAAVWAGSLFIGSHRVDFGLTHWIEVSRGRVEVWSVHHWRDTPRDLSYKLATRRGWPDRKWNMLPWYGTDSAGVVVVFPLWIPLVLSGIPAAILWRRHGPLYLGWQCRFCGYDARGLRGQTCPECGNASR